MRLRFGRGRRPDPTREGTVYRARPGFRVGNQDSAGSGDDSSMAGATPQLSSQDFWAAQSGGRTGTATRPAPSRPAATRPKRRRRRLWPWLLVVLLAYPLVLGVLAWSSVHRIDAFPDGDRPAGSAGTTFLVVGSDSRADLSREERAKLGTGQSTGTLTDTIMVLHVKSGSPTVLMSIPRDSYVEIPGHGKSKINAAFAKGGAPLLVATVEQATGLRIDRFVMTGLGQFATVVDAVGGIRVCPKRALDDSKAHINIKAGCQQVNGKTALGYARARYSDPEGDLGRVKRQREVLASIANKTLSPAVLFVPWRAVPAASAGGDALTVDNRTMPWHLGQFVWGMRKVTASDGVSVTVPIGAERNTSAGASLIWDEAKAAKLFTAIRENDSAALAKISAEQKK